MDKSVDGDTLSSTDAPDITIWLALVHVQEICLRNDLFVRVEVLRPSQRDGIMSSAVSLPNHTFTGQA